MLVAGAENVTRQDTEREYEARLNQLRFYSRMMEEIANSLSEDLELQESLWKSVDAINPMISRRLSKLDEDRKLLEVVR